MTRAIIHLDLDAFFCAVEELHNPALAGRAFAVGARPEERGVVASCSYPARRRGVHSAMPMSQALRLCPGLLIVPPHHTRYETLSLRVMARLHALTPLVEQISIDEAFLDVSARPEAPADLARDLQAAIRRDLGLPCSLGVASNKLVAKIANTVGKAAARGDGPPPNAITVVPPGEEAAFLAPLPCDALWGVGPKTAARLAELGLHTIGDLARTDPRTLAAHLGKTGHEIAQHARGRDDRPIVTDHEPKSISQETTFVQDVRDDDTLLTTLASLVEGVVRELRRGGLRGSTVKLKLRWPDFTTPTRQMTLTQPTDDPTVIYHAATQLLARLRQPGQPVRLIGVGVSSLTDRPGQLGLFEPPDERRERALAAVAAVRARFGPSAVIRGSDISRRRS